MTDRKPDGNGPSGMDHPEQYKTDEESLFDRFESEQTVDPIPVEELNEKVLDEKNKEETKHTSSTEKKYKVDFE
ncbi:hypothetical protein J2Z69_001549 [Paenibacillus shirakamiensis]|uniref:YfhD family protein n=1 Tax=Paenibacillus shirakamiensis TaxID=1265935 RepID=A0ABS4JFP0_9BACL|nr:hypothetical protein [Paenibacillus shirakamiensis]MBP2000518.1 hypothetical protein [Paenibacillus shirakamiensis]